jgi:N-acyl-D-amino-acid deacylase
MDDLLIRGATVIDGTGGPPQYVDVAVRDGRISAVEVRRTGTAAREIDGRGRVLAPGFIDIHTHSDFTLPLNPLG